MSVVYGDVAGVGVRLGGKKMHVCLWARAGVGLALIPIPVEMSGGRDENETTMKTLSFGEIVRGRDASVRVTEDGFLYAIELAQVMTGADAKYASQVILIENPIRDFCRLGKNHVCFL